LKQENKKKRRRRKERRKKRHLSQTLYSHTSPLSLSAEGQAGSNNGRKTCSQAIMAISVIMWQQ